MHKSGIPKTRHYAGFLQIGSHIGGGEVEAVVIEAVQDQSHI